jgi:drug/metabolite transporter (DMT)-like permease
MSAKRNAYIAAIVYAMIIGLSFLFVKQTLTVASPLDTLAHRFSIAWLAATVWLLATKQSVRVTKSDLRTIAPLAVLYPVLFFAFQVFGLLYSSSSEAGIILATVPIFTLVFAGFVLKETSTPRQKIAIGLSVLGVIYILYMNGAGTGKSGSILGSGLLVLSAVVASLYNVLARRLTQRYSLFTLTYVMSFFGFITFNVLALSDHLIRGTVHQFFQPFLHADFVVAALYLGVLSSLLTSYLSNFALSRLPASQMSVFSNLATLITVMAGIVFLQEAFHYYHAIGAGMIIAGIIGVNVLAKAKREREGKRPSNS